jgi:hypothetical protein
MCPLPLGNAAEPPVAAQIQLAAGDRRPGRIEVAPEAALRVPTDLAITAARRERGSLVT